MSRARVDDVGYAERVNAAAGLLAAGLVPVEAARVVAQRFAVSVRQGRRYVEAAVAGPVEMPEVSVVFTVNVPASLAARAREYAHSSGCTISAVVARALTEYLQRPHRERPAR